MIDEQFFNSGEIERGVFEPFYGEYRKKSVREKVFAPVDREQIITHVHRNVPVVVERTDVVLPGAEIEFSVYDSDKNLQYWKRSDNYELDGLDFRLDVREDIEEANIPDGANYILRYNFFNPKIGSGNFYVNRISNDGREIRVRVNPDASTSVKQAFNETFGEDPQPLDLVLNFGNNRYYHVLNWEAVANVNEDGNVTFDANGKPVVKEAVIRIEETLSDSISVGDDVWLDFEVGRPYFDRFQIFRSEEIPAENELADPNFTIDFENSEPSGNTFETFEDLTESEEFSTSKSFVETRINSTKPVRLNVDFTDFENFIQYSSAEERLKNFRYKIKNIYKKVNQIKEASESAYENRLKDNIESIIGSFDAYEQWLFRNENGYPKNAAGALKDPETKEIKVWFQEMFSKAASYDDRNDSALRKQVPEFVREDQSNEDFIVFVDMIGHWFDVNWLYIRHLEHLHDAKEDPYEPETLSADLSDVVAESFGFETYNGFDAEDFFDEIFDSDKIERLFDDAEVESSTEIEVTNGQLDITTFQAQQQIWRRLLKNVIHFYKKKSTPSSIETLESILGIPSESLVIRESGGTRINSDEKVKISEKTQYASFFGSQSLEVSWEGYGPAKSIETRFRSSFQGSRSLKIIEIPNRLEVKVNKPDLNSDKGSFELTVINPDGSRIGVQTQEFSVFNGEWTNVLLQMRENEIDLVAQQRSPFGNKRLDGQTSATVNSRTLQSIYGSSTAYIGGETETSSFDSNPFIGDFDQVNVWGEVITTEQFDNHTFAPNRYDFKTDESITVDLSDGTQETALQDPGYFRSQLLYRTDFDDFDSETALVNKSNKEGAGDALIARIVGATENIKFKRYDRTNFLPPVQVGTVSFIKNKIRSESTENETKLYLDKSSDRDFLDRISEDNEKLGIFFSPYTSANRDAIAEIGIDTFNRTLGNPADQFRDSYYALDRINSTYWEKYEEPIDVQKYIRYVDQFYNGLFEHIDKAIPARSSASTGIVIEPSLTERDRHKIPTGSIIE